jgi:hypothetical protein
LRAAAHDRAAFHGGALAAHQLINDEKEPWRWWFVLKDPFSQYEERRLSLQTKN